MSGQTVMSNPADRLAAGPLARFARGRLGAIVIMLPPALILFTLFVALPLVDAGYYSLFKWNGYGSPTGSSGCPTSNRSSTTPFSGRQYATP